MTRVDCGWQIYDCEAAGPEQKFVLGEEELNGVEVTQFFKVCPLQPLFIVFCVALY